MNRAMSEGTGPQGGEIEVTPEEERFLKRFFRRQVLPWFVLTAVIAVTSAWGLRSEGRDDTLEVRTTAAMAQLRADNERLGKQVAALQERVDARPRSSGTDQLEESVENARRDVRMIEARVTAALDRRLDVIETRLGSLPQASAGDGAGLPSDASAWDVSSILERLYALEMRDGASGAGADATSRLADLERRLARIEQREGVASPPPASADSQ